LTRPSVFFGQTVKIRQ